VDSLWNWLNTRGCFKLFLTFYGVIFLNADLLGLYGGVAPTVTMAAVIGIIWTRIQRQVLLNPVRHMKYGMTR
jgi:hypothetical protein